MATKTQEWQTLWRDEILNPAVFQEFAALFSKPLADHWTRSDNAMMVLSKYADRVLNLLKVNLLRKKDIQMTPLQQLELCGIRSQWAKAYLDTSNVFWDDYSLKDHLWRCLPDFRDEHDAHDDAACYLLRNMQLARTVETTSQSNDNSVGTSIWMQKVPRQSIRNLPALLSARYRLPEQRDNKTIWYHPTTWSHALSFVKHGPQCLSGGDFSGHGGLYLYDTWETASRLIGRDGPSTAILMFRFDKTKLPTQLLDLSSDLFKWNEYVSCCRRGNDPATHLAIYGPVSANGGRVSDGKDPVPSESKFQLCIKTRYETIVSNLRRRFREDSVVVDYVHDRLCAVLFLTDAHRNQKPNTSIVDWFAVLLGLVLGLWIIYHTTL